MKICIIGGGCSGWWAAGYLEKFVPDINITLIESDTIPTIGVGESTLPQIGHFFEELEIPESDWMDAAEAIKKYGNIKQGWDHKDAPEFAMTFWYNDNNVFDEWVKDYFAGKKTKDDINKDLYDTNAWRATAHHFDAVESIGIVKDRCKNVEHIIDTVTELPPGYDLYLDCTGLKQQFVKYKTRLPLPEGHLVDRVWVCPWELEEECNFTRTIARDAGWQFIINLQNRAGIGYVYSSKYMSDDDAKSYYKELTDGRIPYGAFPCTPTIQPKLIKWDPHYLANPWSDNVVALGLSNGLLDPLEANVLYTTVYGIQTLAKCLNRGYGPRSYNKAVARVHYENSDFILHHYMLSNRTDTPFWEYYSKCDVRETLWKNYRKRTNKQTNLFVDAIWATLGLYYDEFTYYE